MTIAANATKRLAALAMLLPLACGVRLMAQGDSKVSALSTVRYIPSGDNLPVQIQILKVGGVVDVTKPDALLETRIIHHGATAPSSATDAVLNEIGHMNDAHDLPESACYRTTVTVETGKMEHPPLCGNAVSGGKAKPVAAGDKMLVRYAELNKKADSLYVHLVAFDPGPDGTAGWAQYESLAVFLFPKHSLAELTGDQLNKQLNAGMATILKGDTQATALAHSHPATPPSATVTPPPAPAAQTQTVELGMSVAQVQAALGAPTQQVNLGTKTILVYPNLKITLVDGKVTDVQ